MGLIDDIMKKFDTMLNEYISKTYAAFDSYQKIISMQKADIENLEKLIPEDRRQIRSLAKYMTERAQEKQKDDVDNSNTQEENLGQD